MHPDIFVLKEGNRNILLKILCVDVNLKKTLRILK